MFCELFVEHTLLECETTFTRIQVWVALNCVVVTKVLTCMTLLWCTISYRSRECHLESRYLLLDLLWERQDNYIVLPRDLCCTGPPSSIWVPCMGDCLASVHLLCLVGNVGIVLCRLTPPQITCQANIPHILEKCRECRPDMSSNSAIWTMPDDMTCHVKIMSGIMSADSFGHKEKTAKLCKIDSNGMIWC